MRDDVQIQEDERVWGHVEFGINQQQKYDLANDGDCRLRDLSGETNHIQTQIRIAAHEGESRRLPGKVTQQGHIEQ